MLRGRRASAAIIAAHHVFEFAWPSAGHAIALASEHATNLLAVSAEVAAKLATTIIIALALAASRAAKLHASALSLVASAADIAAATLRSFPAMYEAAHTSQRSIG